MNELDFSFEPTPWELARDKLGETLSAVRFLTLMEGEDEQTVLDALEELLNRHVALDIQDLPEEMGNGKLSNRLRLERALVERGDFPNRLDSLEQTDPLRIYLEELALVPAAGDPEMLAQCYAEGQTEVAERLVNLSLSQVLEEAKNLVGRGVLLLDLIQEGSLGLWQSVLNYTGGSFQQHSRFWIRQAMVKAVVLQARENGVGRRMLSLMEQYRAADRALLTHLGRNPMLEEIALEMHIAPEEAETVRQNVLSAGTLERAKPKQTEENTEDTAYFQMRQRIMELLSELEPLDEQILTLRFGLDGRVPLSPQQTGGKLGLPAQEIMRREAAALAKLRREK